MKKMVLGLVIVLGAVFAGGCALGPPRAHVGVTISDFVAGLNPVLLDRCPPLPSPEGQNSGDLLKRYTELQGQYNGCAIKDDCLLSALTQKPFCAMKENPTATPVQRKTP